VKFKGAKVPVVLQFGNSSGAKGGLLGIGVVDNGKHDPRKFMYRMDFHDPAPNHGGAGNIYQRTNSELAYWVSGSYHHHVLKYDASNRRH
jgi:hypothetical protein